MERIQPRKRVDLIVKKMGEETILYDENANEVHSLNVTASLIWDLCDGQRDLTGIAGEVLSQFDIDESSALSDVKKTLRDFQKKGLLMTS